MINLQLVRIKNFRAISDATFRPLEDGITGLQGPNGSGKSTILAATMWAMFGIRPADATVDSLRRSGSSKEECYVSVVFTHLGQTVEIVRELRGRNNQAIVTIYLEREPVAIASVNAANAWVVQRLGVDAEGFLTAFVVRQKELDDLVTATNGQRRAVIERLAGIDTINAALKSARRAQGANKDVLETMGGSEEESLRAENTLQAAESERDLHATKLEAFQKKRVTITKALQVAQSEFSAVKDDAARLRLVSDRLITDEAALASVEQDLKEFSSESLSTSKEDAVKKRVELLEEYSARRAEATLKQTAFEALRNRRASVENAVTSNQNQIELISSRLVQLELDISERTLERRAANLVTIENLKKTVFEQEELESTILARINVLIQRQTDLTESVGLLQHAAECPTCHTTLADPAALLASFQLQAQEAAAEEIKLSEDRAALEISPNKQRIAILEKQVELLDSLFSTSSELKELLSSKQIIQQEMSEAESELHEIASVQESLISQGTEMKRLLEDYDRIERAVQRRDTLLVEIPKIKEEVDTLTKKLGVTSVETLEKRVQSLNAEANTNDNLLNDSINTHRMADRQYGVAREKSLRANSIWKQRQERLKEAERLAAVTTVLDKFRSDTVGSLAPQLAEQATDLISRMTGGEFSEILLDEEFNTSVVINDGSVRPVTWLSGGELSAVALALRIAIGNLITGGAPELLWLDEVFTAQDAERRASILTLIRGLQVKQVIMMNHTEEATSIVDRLVTVIPDRRNGSRILAEELDGDAPENYVEEVDMNDMLETMEA